MTDARLPEVGALAEARARRRSPEEEVAEELGLSESEAERLGLVPRGRCSNCPSHFPERDTFEFRGLHFCFECVGALASWFLDGGMQTDPEMFGWVLESTEVDAPLPKVHGRSSMDADPPSSDEQVAP